MGPRLAVATRRLPMHQSAIATTCSGAAAAVACARGSIITSHRLIFVCIDKCPTSACLSLALPTIIMTCEL